NPPTNSHLQFDALLSWSSWPDLNEGGWTSNSYHTYVKKNRLTSVEEVNSKLEDLVEKYVGPTLESGLGFSFDKFREQGGIYSHYIYPMTETHLYTSHLQHDILPKSDIANVYIFLAVGIFILLIASINFMNLSTARSANRAKEVGLRKTLGSFRSTMVAQFLIESCVYAITAALVSVGLVYFLLPAFNEISGKELYFTALFQPSIISAVILLTLFVGLMSGSYPAIYLTSFKAVEVLKGKLRAGMKSGGLRSTLVVLQFSLSIVLIICTILGFQQINYLQNRNLGIDKKNVLIIRNTSRLSTHSDGFRTAVKEQSTTKTASFTNNVFPGVNNTTVFRSVGNNADHIMGTYYADYEHQDVMKFELKEGRYFSRDFATDSTAIIINEAAVKEMGLKSPLNEEILSFNGPAPTTLKIIGVAKDFNFESLKEKVRPLVIQLSRQRDNNLLIRYDGSAKDAVASVEGLWKKLAPSEPFEYAFLDENYDALFRSEQRLSKLFTVFTILAIAIACMGLFGLASFTAEQRTKEIGIRKVMGASHISVASLLSREFTKLVVISFLIAIAPAYYLVNYWLNQFAYHVSISVLAFVAAGLGALLLAWLTVGYQSLKAASAKPVNSLRYE
ncbi:MAG: FtsX-like permease family protein, partial [Flammeovirgaceae bacterium]|nr:FtsX-like permease family protein [Flammeovirgaceae bacterium]